MFRKLLLCCVLLLASTTLAFAQTGTITGTVSDAETGETVPGANVRVQEVQRGAATDAEGNFTISNIPVGTYTLRITYVGYQTNTQQIQVQEGENEVNVQLNTGEVGLEELVVTGYGVETKRELTGSISSVNSEDFEDIPLNNTEGILQGRAAGVQVTTTSGTPGAGFQVDIRGTGSINAGTDPLYIVDGVQISTTNQNGLNDSSPLNAIAPENIESIEVLKDAAAASIYGSQAANGVVLITTKRGTAGDTQVSLSVNRGVTSFAGNKNVDFWNSQQFVEYNLAALQYDNPGASAAVIENFYRTNTFPQFGIDPDTPIDQLPNTDWFDFTTRQAATQEYRATVSGGTETSRYRISAGYEGDEGYIKANEFRNISFSGNFDQQISSKFTTRLSLNLSNQNFVGPCQDGFFVNCPVSASSFISPLARPFNEDGSPSTGFPVVGSTSNPAIILDPNNRRRETDIIQVLGNINATYNFQPWLSLGTTLGLDYRQESESNFSSPIAQPGTGGQATEVFAPTTNFTSTTTLNFNRSLDEVNNLSGLLGFEYRRNYTRQISGEGQGFPANTFSVVGATANPTGSGGFNSEFRRVSYFGQVKYNYDQRYFVKLTGRFDGDSRFGENNRFGFFPAASVAWDIAGEDFFNADAVESLKLRAGLGQTGNSGVGFFQALGLFAVNGTYNGASALRANQLANPDLTWEVNTQANVGLDYSMFNNRLTGSVELYRDTRSDLLLASPLPGDSGFNSIFRNIGKVRNQGVEFQIQTVNVRSRDFQWSTRLNFAVNQNEVLELNEGTQELNPNAITPIAVGRSIGAIQTVEYAGVNPADGRPLWYDADGELTYSPNFNDDAQFNDAQDPDVNGGFGTKLSYKGLSFNAFFNFSYGATVEPQQIAAFNITQPGVFPINGIERRLTNAWRQPGDIAAFPAPSGNTTYAESSFSYANGAGSQTFYDASYLRLKNVTLAYSLPASLTSQLGLRDVRFNVTGLNLLTWTSFPGFDPEIVNNTSQSGGNNAQASIPVGRTITGGINVRF